MLKEFRDFLFRGNIVELAIAFVLGVAFGALVKSFVDNLVMPVIAMIATPSTDEDSGAEGSGVMRSDGSPEEPPTPDMACQPTQRRFRRDQ